MRFGKKPARPLSVKLRLAKYVSPSKLPAAPEEFGKEWAVAEWNMLANDRYGCCVFSGAAHETLLWGVAGGAAVPFDDASVLADYSAVTGFDPGDYGSDQGTDVGEAARYRMKTGIVDALGNRHKVAAYAAIEAGDLDTLLSAAYLFGAVGIGIAFPNSAQGQFDAGEPWSVVPGSPVVGGHYVPVVARRSGKLAVVTWGKVQDVEDDFFRRFNDEAVVYLSEEMLSAGKSIEGFDLEQLKVDLAALVA